MSFSSEAACSGTRVTASPFQGDFIFAQDAPFRLDSGGALQPVTLHYALYGEPNADRSNVALVCHALSGSALVHEWWPQVFETLLPRDRFCVLGVNILGSCYGSTGPQSRNPKTERAFAAGFPLVSVSDIVRSQAALLDHLKIGRLQVVIGASVGGMQALQWAIDYPERVEEAIAIGAAPLGAMGLALNHLQRQSIRLDPEFHGGQYTGESKPRAGLALAREIAMCSYKSAALFEQRHGRNSDRSGEDPYAFATPAGAEPRFDVAGYLDHQGQKFNERFDANAYISITRTMDTFDPVRAYGSAKAAYGRIRARVLTVGIASDWLFPAAAVREMSSQMHTAGVRCEYREQVSDHGHDAFLAEPGQLMELLRPLI